MDMIYKITSPNGKVYIGRTSDFNRRMAEHKYNALTRKFPNSLYKAIRKYGWDSMSKTVLFEIESDKAQKLEEELIVAYNSVRGGYNDSYAGTGGDQWIGKRDTNEFMEFVSKMKTINSGKSNGMYGKEHTEEAKEKQKEKAKGRFSLPWFIERHGEEEGTTLYNKRCQDLKNRKIDWRDPITGDFVKKEK